MQTSNRNRAIDTLRAIALIGICVVNVKLFANSTKFTHPAAKLPEDKLYEFITTLFFDGKFFLIFSFLLGWGIYIQKQEAQRRGIDFKTQYRRRALGLAFLGILNAVFIFIGDILLPYAILSFFSLIFLDKQPDQLIAIAKRIIKFSIFIPLAIIFPFSAIFSSSLLELEFRVSGGFIEATTARIEQWPVFLILDLIFMAPQILLAICIAIAAAKIDFFSDNCPHHEKLSRLIPYFLIGGLAVNLYQGLGNLDILPSGLLFAEFNYLSAILSGPILSTAYVLIFFYYFRNFRLPYIFELAGQNSLSTYILQGILAGFVFYDYGLGLFGQIKNLELLALGIGIALVSMTLVGLTALIFGRGPLEIVLRKLTFR